MKKKPHRKAVKAGKNKKTTKQARKVSNKKKIRSVKKAVKRTVSKKKAVKSGSKRKAAKKKPAQKKTSQKAAKRQGIKPKQGGKAVKTSAGAKKKTGPKLPPKPTPQENLSRPFNIIESYMGTYSFDDIYAVLFVCTGNMCRSPLAEGILKKKVSEEAPEGLREKFFIQSSGIYAYEGNKPSESAVKTALQNMIDISPIRSKPLNRVFIEQSDLILALSIDHLNFINENFPSARGKTHLLKSYGQNRPIQMADSIPDPMGFSMEFYAKTFSEIKNAIDAVFPTIIRAAESKLGRTNA